MLRSMSTRVLQCSFFAAQLQSAASFGTRVSATARPNTFSQIVLASHLMDDTEAVDYCVDIPGCCGVGQVGDKLPGCAARRRAPGGPVDGARRGGEGGHACGVSNVCARIVVW